MTSYSSSTCKISPADQEMVIPLGWPGISSMPPADQDPVLFIHADPFLFWYKTPADQDRVLNSLILIRLTIFC